MLPAFFEQYCFNLALCLENIKTMFWDFACSNFPELQTITFIVFFSLAFLVLLKVGFALYNKIPQLKFFLPNGNSNLDFCILFCKIGLTTMLAILATPYLIVYLIIFTFKLFYFFAGIPDATIMSFWFILIGFILALYFTLEQCIKKYEKESD